MCGIAGLLGTSGDEVRLTRIARDMSDRLAHRGPDASGVWVDAGAQVAFGHRRLSILELSAAGAQPMATACGRLVISFNGEIYNHLDLRRQLSEAGAQIEWRGHSDTETLLYAVREWGIAQALHRAVGMFAFALWDRSSRTLTLARDRFGEKPLYYGRCGRSLVFASELKALAAHPDWRPDLNRTALTSFMRYSYVPTPLSIWNDIFKLTAGHFISFNANVDEVVALPEPVAYWSSRDRFLECTHERIDDPDRIEAELEYRLSTAIDRVCLSDVPLGAFLSGGIDSSTIVALMQARSSQPVRTFTIGFSESGFDEAADAREVARHLGTSHTELRIDPVTARDVIPKLPRIYDEPFADSSQIPTHLVSMLTRQHVTVALSGDGGDELFGGYNRHVWGPRLHARLNGMPSSVRQAGALALTLLPSELLNRVAPSLYGILPSRLHVRRPGDQLEKLARLLKAQSFDDVYRQLCSIDLSPERTVLGGREQESATSRQLRSVRSDLQPADFMMLADIVTYLSDDILHKLDRAAMAVGLETRVPFLDRDVVELAWRIRPELKIRDGHGKWPLRRLLAKYVPPALTDRPKTGFGIPRDDWLRGPLKSWALDLLSPSRLRNQGLFDAEIVNTKLHQHMRGEARHGSWLWNMLMAQAWWDEWGGPKS